MLILEELLEDLVMVQIVYQVKKMEACLII